MSLTLNQIVERIETLALSHRQINHFYLGDPVDFLTTKGVIYPACFLEMPQSGSRIDRDEKGTFFRFRLWLSDLGDVAIDSQLNETEVMSDLTSMMQDLAAMLGFTDYRDWDFIGPGSLQYFTEKFEDLTVSVSMDFEIKVRFDGNRCQVPAANVTFETARDMLIDIYRMTGTGAEGASVTIGTLNAKNILMLFKGDKLLMPTSGTPTPDQYKYNGAGLFEFGNDIEAGQVIQILYKNL